MFPFIGASVRTVTAWNRWRETFDSWNLSQSNDALIKDPLLAGKYEAAARKLGEPIAERVSNEIRHERAQGKADKVIECINTVITDYEAELLSAGG